MTLARHSLGAALALALMCAAPVSLADGGGGGGGSMSAPSQGNQGANPAEAYRDGVAALQAQDYRTAIRHFRTARRGAPNDPTINYALGLAHIGAGEAGDARGPLERSVRSESAPAAAWLQLGRVYLELGERDRAVAQQAALQGKIDACDAACGDTRRNELRAAHQQLTQALDTPAAAPAANPATTGWNFPSEAEGRAAYAEAVGLINQERYAEAFSTLTRVQAAVGPHPDVLNYMGFTSRKLGRLDASLGYYSQALALDPNHLGANEYLGELYIQMGDMARARAQLARLDQLCAYGCAQREELARWIEAAR